MGVARGRIGIGGCRVGTVVYKSRVGSHTHSGSKSRHRDPGHLPELGYWVAPGPVHSFNRFRWVAPAQGDRWGAPAQGDRWLAPAQGDRLWSAPAQGDRWVAPAQGDRGVAPAHGEQILPVGLGCRCTRWYSS